jgi:excisionase family DNA binding protein
MTAETPTLPVWMTFKEACLYSRLGHHTIRQLLHQGKIRGGTSGRSRSAVSETCGRMRVSRRFYWQVFVPALNLRKPQHRIVTPIKRV